MKGTIAAIEAINTAVRPLVTIILTLALTWGFIYEKIGGEAFLGIVGMVIGFWFNKREDEKDAGALVARVRELEQTK